MKDSELPLVINSMQGSEVLPEAQIPSVSDEMLVNQMEVAFNNFLNQYRVESDVNTGGSCRC